jgi:hypothetical protein
MEITLQIMKKDGFDYVAYVGPINEESEVHLAPLLQSIGSVCVFNFERVDFVNSCGVRSWINFMREFSKDRKIQFERCTPEIVMQMNMIPSFKGNAVIGSVFGSYTCVKCSSHKSALFQAGKNLPASVDINLAPVNCDKCGSAMEFDELEEEYFAFNMAG